MEEVEGGGGEGGEREGGESKSTHLVEEVRLVRSADEENISDPVRVCGAALHQLQ